MGEYNFKLDLITGREYEIKFIEFLISKGKNIISYCRSNDNSNDLTVTFDYGTQTFEVKSDHYSLDYPINYRNIIINPDGWGTIVIEFESWGKPSGIKVTTANWWVHYMVRMQEIWIIKSEDLRFIIDNNIFQVKEGMGDPGSNTKGYLIPRNKFRKFFKTYKYGG